MVDRQNPPAMAAGRRADSPPRQVKHSRRTDFLSTLVHYFTIERGAACVVPFVGCQCIVAEVELLAGFGEVLTSLITLVLALIVMLITISAR
ncbi:MAG TPA: hypothetical protein DEF41_08970 [Desulfovibrio sp.]|nr:hypothetical protein [Desulfovibrio sp.]